MKREAPKLALAWTDGLKTKRYGTKQAAYYAIAKRMVVEKYPPMLGNAYAGNDPEMLGPGWTDKLVVRRMDKMFALFCTEDAEGYFCERMWRRFITRVARFLAFVDSKRTAAELLELRFGGDEDLKRANAEWEASENASVKWAERARDIRVYIETRSRR